MAAGPWCRGAHSGEKMPWTRRPRHLRDRQRLYRAGLLDEDPAVGLGEHREDRGADGEGESGEADVRDERDPARGDRAVAHVERARAAEGDGPIRVHRAARDPAAHRDVLIETDEARAVVLRLEVADGRAVIVDLHA